MKAARDLVKRGSVLVDAIRPTDGLVVLIYHRVGGRTTVSVDLPGELFDDQMAMLAERYRAVRMDEVPELLEAGHEAAHKPVVAVTFDDGTADFVEEAVPILVDHGIPAMLYLATEHVDAARMFPDDGVPMSWSAAREAVASGMVDIGSHSHSHILFDRVSTQVAVDDLDRSIELIGSQVGVEARHFAYPKALLASPHVEPEIRRRFRTAAIGRTRPNAYGRTDLHRLTRSPIQHADGMRWFERKVGGGMSLENDVRNLLNRWRYRNISS